MDRLALLDKAKRNPSGVRFADVCALAEAYGWKAVRQRASHALFKRPGTLALMNFQADGNGMAKAYQVRQLVRAIEKLGD